MTSSLQPNEKVDLLRCKIKLLILAISSNMQYALCCGAQCSACWRTQRHQYFHNCQTFTEYIP